MRSERTINRLTRPRPSPQNLPAGLPRWVDITRVYRLAIYIDVPDAIVPGEPFLFTWTATNPLGLPLDLGDVTAALYLLDATNKRVAPTTPLFTVGVDGKDVAAGNYTSPPLTVPALGSGDPQAALLYQVGGPQGLELELTGTGADVGPFVSGWGGLSVVAEDPPLDWSWSDPPDASPAKDVAWKVGYFLSGVLTNSSKFSDKDCSLTLQETDPDGNQANIGPDNEPARLHKNGGHTTTTFGGNQGRVQQWGWFVSFVNSINGPTDKWFDYTIAVDVTDEFGNVYPTIRMRRHAWVHVTVSDQKINSANAGEISFAEFVTLAAFAAATSWIPGVGAAFGVLAAAAASIAAGCSKIADDPPQANLRYKSTVEVPAPEFGAAVRDCEALANLVAVFEASLQLVQCVDALSEVEGRMLGAQADRDAHALKIQLRSYEGFLESIGTDAKRLVAHVPEVAGELDGAHLIDRSRLDDGDHALRSQLRDGIVEGELRRDVLRMSGACGAEATRFTHAYEAVASMAACLCLLASAAISDGRRVVDRFRQPR